MVNTERQKLWLPGGVAASLLGFAVHNVREFGVTGGLLAPQNGFLPMALVTGLLALHWWRTSHPARLTALALSGLAALHLLGAVLTVLPLGVLPFSPDQSAGHYLSHVVYGLAQIPLLVMGLRRP